MCPVAQGMLTEVSPISATEEWLQNKVCCPAWGCLMNARSRTKEWGRRWIKEGKCSIDLPWRSSQFHSRQIDPLESLLPWLSLLRMVSSEELSLNKEWFLAGRAPIELKFSPVAQGSLLPLPQLALTTGKPHAVGDREDWHMRVVQREQAEKMNAKKHKRKEMFTETRPRKGAGERVPSSWHCGCWARTPVTTAVCPALPCLPWLVPVLVQGSGHLSMAPQVWWDPCSLAYWIFFALSAGSNALMGTCAQWVQQADRCALLRNPLLLEISNKSYQM